MMLNGWYGTFSENSYSNLHHLWGLDECLRITAEIRQWTTLPASSVYSRHNPLTSFIWISAPPFLLLGLPSCFHFPFPMFDFFKPALFPMNN